MPGKNFTFNSRDNILNRTLNQMSCKHTVEGSTAQQTAINNLKNKSLKKRRLEYQLVLRPFMQERGQDWARLLLHFEN